MEMESSCKLFIGGISWETTEDRLREYFQSFGEVLEAVIMKDRATGRARGFGFLVFADPTVAERVVLIRHVIDGKIVEAKKAVPRDDHVVLNRSSSSLQGSPGPATSKKIFVGGLASSVTEAEFKKYFAQFGTITDVVVMYDHRTQRPRGFGFISFESEEAVDRVLQRTFHELNGKMVEVKLAVPKEMALNPIRNQMNVNSFGSSRISALLMNEYTQGFSQSPISGYGVQPEVRYSPGVGGNRGGFSPFGHGFGIELNFEPGHYGSGSNAGFGRPFSPGYAASQGRYGSQIESGVRNNLWGNGGGLGGYMSNSPISRSSFNGNSGMSSLGSIGDNWGGAARARSGYRSEGGGLGLDAMRGVHVGGYSSGSSSLETESLYSDSAWLSPPAKSEERLGMGAFDFVSKGPAAGYINRQPNGDVGQACRLSKMAGRLFGVASRIMGGNGVVARSGAASLRQRAGMGLPVGKHIVPDKRLSVNDELMWDNGTAFPEPCIDRIADTVGKYEALGWLCGGLGFFATLGLLAVVNDKASKVPFVSDLYFNHCCIHHPFLLFD
ncbi:BnaC09g20300D [Brassica napus]|uniref:(rape) hypothetical protein n=1 Tax=Brassica napus TaxID=3708 RepID=A0A078GLB9_BRANA|nr:unnamed protein product [Brassica napus]CDY25957.1 BnaC09g20300D [Brassica napus]